VRQAEHCLNRRGVAAGCFTMHVEADGLLFRWIDRVATARVRLAGMIFGDQGLFVPAVTFKKVGSFPPLRIMEDVVISRRLRRLGRMIVVPAQVHVSPRRWQRAGVVRQTLRNWSLLALTAGGVHPNRLARFYPAIR